MSLTRSSYRLLILTKKFPIYQHQRHEVEEELKVAAIMAVSLQQ